VCVLLNVFAGLENDCKEIMKEIEVKLHELHAFIRDHSLTSPMETDETSLQTYSSRIPFARIDQVDENSPASTAVSLFLTILVTFSL